MNNELKIVTFNVRCTWDCEDGFVSRMGLIYDKICKKSPDVVAFQEVTEPILKALQTIMPDYLFVGHGRNPDYDGEAIYIAINKNTVHLIGLETFWIAPNPYDKNSKYSDQSDCPRICVSTSLLHIKSKTEFRVFNVHLDHIGVIAKAEGMKCVLNKAKEANRRVNMPTVILGDFNDSPDGQAINTCNEWGEPRIYDITSELSATFHGYGRLKKANRENVKIDYIYVTENLKEILIDIELWEDELNGHLLSDHFPICATFNLKQGGFTNE